MTVDGNISTSSTSSGGKSLSHCNLVLCLLLIIFQTGRSPGCVPTVHLDSPDLHREVAQNRTREDSCSSGTQSQGSSVELLQQIRNTVDDVRNISLELQQQQSEEIKILEGVGKLCSAVPGG